MPVTLESLFRDCPFRARKGRGAREVTCLVTDSRRVVPGALFFAIGGRRTDGNLYIDEAVDRGAVAVVSETAPSARFPIDCIQVDDVREALARVSRVFHGAPDERLRLSGVTGTNGKTTVALLLQHLLGGSERVGLVGTIRYDLGRRSLPAYRTTPESVDLFALLAQMADNGCEAGVMEVSSHGLDQKRVFGIGFEVGAFLNLTQDHIDYHGSMEAYYAAKRGLFTGLAGRPPKVAVVNIDDPYGRRLLTELPEEMSRVTFGFGAEAQVRAARAQLFADRTIFDLYWPEGRTTLVSPLLGRFNVSNLLAALAMARAAGHEIGGLIRRVADFTGVPGRMQRVDCGQDFNLVVDYAHTDDALRNACGMLNEITPGRLLVVFGCGGDRDRGKRPLMMRAVLEGAEAIWATADNPRGEALDQIFEDMRAGMDAAGEERVRFVEDRRQAIHEAISAARPGDCVLIAGKGHETFQEFNGSVISFDDRGVAAELIRLRQLQPGAARGPAE